MANQGTIAKELGCSKNHMNAVLNARTRCSYDLAERMAEKFGGEAKDYIKVTGDKGKRIARYRRYKALRNLQEANMEIA